MSGTGMLKLVLAALVVALAAETSAMITHPSAVLPRMKAPSFRSLAVVNDKFQHVSLSDYSGASYAFRI